MRQVDATDLAPEPPRVLWADEFLLAIDKPAGLPTLPDGYARTAPHVRSALEPHFGRVWIVHRLDRDTSGVLIVARTAQAHRALNTQFDAHTVEKIYHALVIGSPGWDQISVDSPLEPDGDRRHRTVISPQGKPATTHLRVIERLGAYTLIEAIPKTGRTHQIRAHLAAQGFPIAADALYGGGESLAPHLNRMGLHALALTALHPISGVVLHFEAPYPHDFTAALAALRQRPS
jgi:RluA family pseudouridine synthase